MMQRTALTLALAMALAAPPLGWAEDKKPKNDKANVEKIGDRDVDGGINFYSIEKEIALGKQLADEVERNARIVDDPIISEYVNRIGQNIVRNSDAQVPFTIKVIDNAEINAFALPGGYFYVNTGLIQLAQSEAELAGVMAHEIAHVNARHGTRQATRGQVTNLATIPLIFLGGWTGYGIRQAAGLAVPLTFLKFSRGFEEEADFLGVQYLWKAGYDPAAMVTFFERIQAQKKKKDGGVAKVFSSHPLTKDRIKKTQQAIAEVLPERPQYAYNTSEFAEVKTRLERTMAVSRKQSDDPNRPTLRRKPSDGTIPAGESGDPSDDEERPTLKRRNSG